MKEVAVSELKARLSTYLREVRGGARVIVTDRGKPIAELIAYGQGGQTDAEAAAVRLEQQGILREREKTLPFSVPSSTRPKLRGSPASDSIIEDRHSP